MEMKTVKIIRKDEQHPAYRRYLNYRNAMRAQLAEAMPFRKWLTDKGYPKEGFHCLPR